ncbi:MAG: glycoside hydrolase family 2 protein [Clostridia bacterium]|nr:glycoside hydrolase family 2 protein [Clostridia bacterium]
MPRYEQTLMNGWKFALNTPQDFQPVHLPHDWIIHFQKRPDGSQWGAQGYLTRESTGYYRKTLTLDRVLPGHLYWLDFGGIFENSTVTVNGVYAGGRKYGYSPFRLDITPLVHAGDNMIEVTADNTQMPADRWYSGGGIYRTVKLIVAEEKHLNEQEVIVRTEISGADAVVTVQTGTLLPVCGVLSREDEICFADSENGVLTFSVPEAALWSAETPNLYTLTLNLMDGERIADTISMRIGIREVAFDVHSGMLVNGVPTPIRGGCVHQDAGCRGIAARPEIWRERLQLLKEAGVNTIRAAHHLYCEEFLDLCDEMGFYVYEEPFDKWKSGAYARYFDTEWQRDTDVMVRRDRNRPSIIIWGAGNEVENQGQPSMIAILKMIADRIRSLDPTRPVTYAINPHFKYESNIDASKVKDIQAFVDEVDDREIEDLDEKMRRIARIGEHVDILSCNYMEQWYELIHQAVPDKPILGTEIYQCFMGHMNAYQNFTEDSPLLAPEKYDYVLGGIIWSAYDYLGESMGWPAKGWGGAFIRTNCQRKPWYHVIKSYWTKEPMVHFSVLDYTQPDECVKEAWDTPPYADHWHFPHIRKRPMAYMIATNCEEVRLHAGGRIYYPPKPAECPNRLVTGYIPYAPGRVLVEGCIGGKVVCTHEVFTHGDAAQLVWQPGGTELPAEEGYEALFTVETQDANGIHCFHHEGRAAFRVDGPAEIVGVDNGCMTIDDPYGGASVALFQGRASVQIRLTGESGPVTLHAAVDGLPADELKIRVD